MRAEFIRQALRNWPMKLAALALSLLLYARVQTLRFLTEEYEVPLDVQLPAGRRLTAPPPPVRVKVTGRGSTLLTMRTLPGIVTRQIPDTFCGTQWVLDLQTADVRIPSGLDVTVLDVAPREVTLALNAVAVKLVPVIPLVRLVPDTSFEFTGAPAVTPGTVRLMGSAEALAAVESVTTVPIEVRGTPGPFLEAGVIDASSLPDVQVSPARVTVSGEVGTLIERSFPGIAVESGAGGLTGLSVQPPRVVVVVRGPGARVRTLTRDSVHVIAVAATADTGASYARLTVLAPPGVTARAVPDSVLLRRRGGD